MAITLKINTKPVTLDEFAALLKGFCKHEYPIDNDFDGLPERVIKEIIEDNAEDAAKVAAIMAATTQLYEDTTFVKLLVRWACMLYEADEVDLEDYDGYDWDPYDEPDAVANAIKYILFG